MEIISFTSRKSAIMRRIYLSYAISFTSERYFWNGVLFGVALGLFAKLVHVASVYHNLLGTPLGQLPQYVSHSFTGALASGEIMTVVTTIILLVLSVLFANRVARLLVLPQLFRA